MKGSEAFITGLALGVAGGLRVLRDRLDSGRAFSGSDPRMPAMWHLFDVGPSKPLGYLCLETIREFGHDARGLEAGFRSRGLGTLLLSPCPERPCGALYVYDTRALQKLIDMNLDVVRRAGWPEEARAFATCTAYVTADRRKNPDLYKLVGVAFNDPRFD